MVFFLRDHCLELPQDSAHHIYLWKLMGKFCTIRFTTIEPTLRRASSRPKKTPVLFVAECASGRVSGWVHKHFIMLPLNWKIRLMIVKVPVTVQHIFSCIFFKSKCTSWPYHFPPACKVIEADAPTPNHEDGTVSPLYLSCILTHGMCKWWTSTLPLKLMRR